MSVGFDKQKKIPVVVHWKANYRSGSGDTETCTTYPSLSLWPHLLPHFAGWLYAVLWTLLFLTPAEHISVSEPLHLLFPVSLMFFSQTATWLPALFPAGLCSQATLIRDTSTDHTMWHTQIHTAALCYCTVFRHSAYHPVISPRTSTAQLWPGVATCECGPVASDFSPLKRSWKFWFLSPVSCKWVSNYREGQIICLVEEQWVG